MLTEEWSVETSPKLDTGSRVTEQFGDDFAACLARAMALRDQCSATSRIHLCAPDRTTDQQRRQLREAGFGNAI
jgi:hypothetical protein